MQNRPFKTLAFVIAGIAYFSGYALSATDSLKNKPAMGASSAPGSPAATPATPPGHAQGGMAQTAQPLTDAQILGVVDAVDEHEIEAANKAMKKKLSAEVEAFAKMLKEQHTMNKETTKKLAKTQKLKTASSPVADSLKAKGKASGKAMASMKGAEYEKAYIDAMVNGHTEVLALLDTQLIPAASSEAVKSHLTEFRGHVAAHLEQGKRLQGAAASATPQ